jgi:hypothetical protein
VASKQTCRIGTNTTRNRHTKNLSLEWPWLVFLKELCLCDVIVSRSKGISDLAISFGIPIIGSKHHKLNWYNYSRARDTNSLDRTNHAAITLAASFPYQEPHHTNFRARAMHSWAWREELCIALQFVVLAWYSIECIYIGRHNPFLDMKYNDRIWTIWTFGRRCCRRPQFEISFNWQKVSSLQRFPWQRQLQQSETWVKWKSLAWNRV